MSDPYTTIRRPNRPIRRRPTSRGFRANRETALRLLNACVEVEKRCFDEILKYVGDNGSRTRGLLEEILRLEEAHAEELIGVLQGHRAANEIRGGARPVPSMPA